MIKRELVKAGIWFAGLLGCRSCIGRGILYHQATREALYIMISNYKRKLEPKQRMTAEVGGVTYKLRPEGSGVSHAIRIEK